MATDIARISYDRGRRYIDTVPQQGRVSLEAEENEQHAIDHVERLKELLDIVGPAGTPDSGYSVSYDGTGSPRIGPGTMYVGGLRVENDRPFMYDAQPDWLDCDGDPAYTTTIGDTTVNEHVVLVLTEVDVTATEDPVLREAALGGPDGAARRRILQRVYQIETTATDCAGATRTDAAVWAAEGLTFDPATMRLNSDSRLLVTWDGPPPKADPCEPTVAGGYLGADNQAIMVKICAVDAEAGTFDFVWGWDNGSNLYRVTADASANPVLTLEHQPVDSYHYPQSGQPVELLRSAAELCDRDGTVEGYVASLTGQVAVLTGPYDPDLKTLTFPATVPTQYTEAAETPQLYLRVWQELHQGVTPGTAVTLTGTGLQVTITAEEGLYLIGAGVGGYEPESDAGKTGATALTADRKPGGHGTIGVGRPRPGRNTPTAVVHLGDYWTIGVRPETPNTVLPDCLLTTPQPPDGPRMWACPLAVIGWRAERFTVLADCRIPFLPLTGITASGGGCCTVSVKPADAANLQKIIDQAAAGRTVGDVSQRITVCLSPGFYELAEPLRLTETHSQLHLEGCGEGAVLAAQRGQESEFDDGLIALVRVRDIKISGITFQPPPATAGVASGSGKSRKATVTATATADMRTVDTKISAIYRDRRVAIALRPVDCTGLSVEDCTFSLALNFDPGRTTVGAYGGTTTTAGADGSTGADPDESALLALRNQAYFAVGIFLGATNKGVSVTGCRFSGVSAASSVYADPTGTTGTTSLWGNPSANLGESVTIGILVAPTLLRAKDTNGVHPIAGVGSRVVAELEGLRIADTSFVSLSAAVLSFAALGGGQVADNTVRECYIGFVFLSLDLPSYLDTTGSYAATGVDQTTMDGLNGAITSLILDPLLLLGYAFGRTYPLPPAYQAATGADGSSDGSSSSTSSAAVTQASWTAQFVKRVTTGDYVARIAPRPISYVHAASSSALSSPSGSAQAGAGQLATGQTTDEATVAWRPTDEDEDFANEPTVTTGQNNYTNTGTNTDSATVTFGTGAANRAELVSGGGSGNAAVRAAALSVMDYELQLSYPTVTAVLKFRIHGNRVECAQPDAYSDTGVSSVFGRTGPALVVVAANQPAQHTGVYIAQSALGFSSVLLDANELAANGTGPVAVLALVNLVTVTGNQVLRQDRDQASIAVLGVDMAAAVTGNVLFGNPMLPTGRSFASPLDTWLPLNTVVY